MDGKTFFKRYELKYLLKEGQADFFISAIKKNMVPDEYEHSSIRNIYFDTEDYLLARRSIEHPLYKEKLRIRSYGTPSSNDNVFVEMKKKYRSIVYKRRLSMPLVDAEKWLLDGDIIENLADCQVWKEIDFMRKRYDNLSPKVFLSYERDSYVGENNLRVTIDRDIFARTTDLSLRSEPSGTNLLPDGFALMEIKTLYGVPRWLLAILSVANQYKIPFSKYGAAYKLLQLRKPPSEYAHLYGIKSAES